MDADGFMDDEPEVITRQQLLDKLSQINSLLNGNGSGHFTNTLLTEANDNLDHVHKLLVKFHRSTSTKATFGEPPSAGSECTVPAVKAEHTVDGGVDGFDEAELLGDLSAEDLFGDFDDNDGSAVSLPASCNEEDSQSEIPSIDVAHDDVPPPSAEHINCLKKYFGHSSFRPLQWKIIRSVLVDRRDNLVIMATGYGKSLCYQFPALYDKSRGVTFVVSPLISLMEDQVTSLRLAGVSACFLGSAQTDSSTLGGVENGAFDLVYVTPEYLTVSSSFLRNIHKSVGVNLIAIDEAHCVSQWGHDFRSSYRQLDCIRKELPQVPILALTATATPSVRRDVCSSLRLQKPQVLCTSFDRPNLYFEACARGSNCAEDMKRFLKPARDTGAMMQYEFPGSTIVYCPTKKMTGEVCSVLQGLGVKVGMYHAGLSVAHRRKTHQDFLMDKLQCVVATVAFGMGIDKPDVRLVIHYGVPKDIESYYQEMGRAGRDGLDSKCYVLYSFRDFVMWKSLLGDINDKNFQIHKIEMISKLEMYVSTTDCRRRALLDHFEDITPYGTKPRKNCCDNCTRRLERPNRSGTDAPDGDGMKEYGKEAHQMLSAIAMWQRGVQTSILFLRGSGSSKLPDWCKTKENYGVGQHLSENWWKSLARMLKNDRYVVDEAFSSGRGGGQGAARFGCTVKRTDKGAAFCRQPKPGSLRLRPTQEMVDAEQQADKSAQFAAAIRSNPSASISAVGLLRVSSTALERASSATGSTTDEELPPSEEQQREESLAAELYQILIVVRAGILTRLGGTGMVTSAASLVSNLTLLKLARQRPGSIETLANVEGMSLEKAQKYGKPFVDGIVDFCRKHGAKLDFDPSSLVRHQTVQQVLVMPSCMKKDLSQTVVCSYNMFHEEGLSLSTIGHQRGVQPSTVGGHLVDAFQAGYPVDYIRAGFTADIESQTLAAVKASGGDLRAAKLTCPDLDYWHLKMAVALLQDAIDSKAVSSRAHGPPSLSLSTSSSSSSQPTAGSLSTYFPRTSSSQSPSALAQAQPATAYQSTSQYVQARPAVTKQSPPAYVQAARHPATNSLSSSNNSATDMPSMKRQRSDEGPAKRPLPNWLGKGVQKQPAGTGAPPGKKKKQISL